MNFYIGNKIEELNYNDNNIRIDVNKSEEYLYKKGLKCKIFYDIDPYNDTILVKIDIMKLKKDCIKILKFGIINDKIFENEISNLIMMCDEALKENKNIICIGD